VMLTSEKKQTLSGWEEGRLGTLLLLSPLVLALLGASGTSAVLTSAVLTAGAW